MCSHVRRAKNEATLEGIAQIMRQHDQIACEVRGMTKPMEDGAADVDLARHFNLDPIRDADAVQAKLSLLRAEACVAELVERGVEAGRLSPSSAVLSRGARDISVVQGGAGLTTSEALPAADDGAAVMLRARVVELQARLAGSADGGLHVPGGEKGRLERMKTVGPGENRIKRRGRMPSWPGSWRRRAACPAPSGALTTATSCAPRRKWRAATRSLVCGQKSALATTLTVFASFQIARLYIWTITESE